MHSNGFRSPLLARTVERLRGGGDYYNRSLDVEIARRAFQQRHDCTSEVRVKAPYLLNDPDFIHMLEEERVLAEVLGEEVSA